MIDYAVMNYLLAVPVDPGAILPHLASVETSGWRAETACDLESAILALRGGGPLLLLLAANEVGGLGDAVGRVRREGGASSAVPIVGCLPAYPADDAALRRSGIDGIFTQGSASTLCAELDRWRPLDIPHPQIALEKAFGAGRVTRLLQMFRVSLAEALEALEGAGLETGEREKPALDPREVHNIVGSAGTLGMTTLSAAWRAIASGDPSSIDVARVLSRKTLFMLDRGCHA